MRIHRLTPHAPLARSARTGGRSLAADVGTLGFASLVRQELAGQAPRSPASASAAAPAPATAQATVGSSIVPAAAVSTATHPPKSERVAGIDYPQDTPNELLTARDRLDQGHGVWYNCGTRLYESNDGSIVGRNPYSVLQYTDPDFYNSSAAMGPILTGDDYYWERQPPAIQKLRSSVTPDLDERARIASELREQGYQIDWPIHVLGVSAAAAMWHREGWLGKALVDISGNPVELPFIEIPKDLPFPGVIRKA